MQYLKSFTIVFLIALLSIVTVVAQDGANDPSTNPDANACYEGGSLEGKCNSDLNGDGVVSDAEIDWSWNCGWYAIRVENGILPTSSVPNWCGSMFEPNVFCFVSWYVWNADLNKWVFDKYAIYNAGEDLTLSGDSSTWILNHYSDTTENVPWCNWSG